MNAKHSCELRPCGIAIQQISKQKRRIFRSISDAVRISVMVGAAGFEPTASSSRTRRATNCAMPRKYRSQLTAVWLGMRESNSHNANPHYSVCLPRCALLTGNIILERALLVNHFFIFSAKLFSHLLCPQKQSVGPCKFFALLLTRCPIRNNLIL